MDCRDDELLRIENCLEVPCLLCNPLVLDLIETAVGLV